MKRIVFTFKENGEVSSDAEGFKGNECFHETERLLKGLNAELKVRKVKAEAYAKTEIKDSVKISE